MGDKRFTIQHSDRWLRPDEAYFIHQEQAKELDAEEVEWNGKYKRIRELRDLSVFGMALLDLYDTPFFVQMNDIDDSPDAFVMRRSPNDGDSLDIGPVELTFYGRNRNGLPKISLADKLNTPKGKFSKLPDGYGLVIHIGIGLEVDHQAISDSLNKIGAKFQVFSIQQIQSSPDTIMQFVAYSPTCVGKAINIGEMCYRLQNSGLSGTVTQVRGRNP